MQIDSTGVTPRDLSGYKTLFEETFRAAFGDALVLDGETPQGQMIGGLAAFGAELDELVVSVANGLSLYSSAGRQVDGLGSFLLLPRIAGERSIVTATFSGAVGTIIEAGAQVKTTDGAIFVLDDDVIIGTGGTGDGALRSAAYGPIPASAGALTVISEVVSGLSSVTNAAAASLGRLAESDAEYRARYPMELALHGRGSLEHIRSRILAVEGVSDCRVVDNQTSSTVTRQNIAIAANSILAIVQGGANADVAAALFASKTGGIPTIGDVSVSVPHAQGETTAVRFRRVASVPLALSVSITIGPGFANNGADLIRARLVQWFTGEFLALGGQFETAGAQIGQAVDQMRLLTPIQSVPGHVVTSYSLTS